MINWQLLALKIRKYKSYSLIEKEIGVSAEHLRKLSRNEQQEPRFSSGIKLLDLAHDLMPAHEFNEFRID